MVDLLSRRRMMNAGSGKIVVPYSEIWYDAPEQVSLKGDVDYLYEHTFKNGRGILRVGTDDVHEWLSESEVTRVYMGDRFKIIKENAFYDCEKLVHVQLPANLLRIETAAFYNCSSLVLTELPSSILSIGSVAFYSCISIPSLTIPITVPPDCLTPFTNTSFPIYVPAESVDTYKQDIDWKRYASRIFAIPE